MFFVQMSRYHGIELGLLPLMFPAIKTAIKTCPEVNASFIDQDGEKDIVLHTHLNFGVAVDTPRGLYVPVLQDVFDQDTLGFASRLEDLLQRAQSNKLGFNDLSGVTFTFNNFGYYGTTMGVQIITPPQSSTLGMGRIEKRPWVVGDELKIRYVADFVLAFDHRVMDGRGAGLFLTKLKEELEKGVEDLESDV